MDNFFRKNKPFLQKLVIAETVFVGATAAGFYFIKSRPESRYWLRENYPMFLGMFYSISEKSEGNKEIKKLDEDAWAMRERKFPPKAPPTGGSPAVASGPTVASFPVTAVKGTPVAQTLSKNTPEIPTTPSNSSNSSTPETPSPKNVKSPPAPAVVSAVV